MKHFLLAVLTIAIAATGLIAQHHEGSASLAGDWQMSFDTPHGVMKGSLKIQQDGAKLTGSCDIESIGAFKMTGSLDGHKVEMSLLAAGSDHPMTLSGAVEAAAVGPSKMSGKVSPHEATWSATRQ